MSLSFEMDWCSPPGATILDALKARHIQVDDFASQLGYPRSIVDNLLSGDHQIDRELAIALSDVIGASPKFWLQRQADYEVDRHVIPSHAVDGIKEWLETLPLADMGRLGWIPSTKSFNEKAIGCLQFFGVNSVEQWHQRYSQELSTVAFRTSTTLASDVRSTAAWLRRGEIEAERMDCAAWNKAKFQSALIEIKALTRTKQLKDFLPELKRIAAACGVAVVVSRTPNGCRASGATKFIGPERALILLSFRYRSDDHFWFTFFHEAAHLILHDTTRLFIEQMESEVSEKEEVENLFVNTFCRVYDLSTFKNGLVNFAK